MGEKILLATLCIALLSYLTTLNLQWLAMRHWTNEVFHDDRKPTVSILKPLKGLDDDLWENLVSFARLNYIDFEILRSPECYPVHNCIADASEHHPPPKVVSPRSICTSRKKTRT